jgi:hypothetical protein
VSWCHVSVDPSPTWMSAWHEVTGRGPDNKVQEHTFKRQAAAWGVDMVAVAAAAVLGGVGNAGNAGNAGSATCSGLVVGLGAAVGLAEVSKLLTPAIPLTAALASATKRWATFCSSSSASCLRMSSVEGPGTWMNSASKMTSPSCRQTVRSDNCN